MKYKIGKVSAFFGMTTESLRNYERAGLIASIKEQDSRQRYFDMETVGKMVGIRSHRNAGLSIKDIRHIYDNTNIDEYVTLLKEKTREREENIKKEQLYLACQKHLVEQAEDYQKNGFLCRVTTRPAMYYLIYRESDFFDDTAINGSQLQQWMEHLLPVRNMTKYDLDMNTGKMKDYSVALALEKTQAEALQLDVSAPVLMLEQGKYLECTLIRPCIREPFGDRFKEIAAYIKNEDLHLDKNGFYYGISTFCFHQNGKKQSFFNLYLPLL